MKKVLMILVMVGLIAGLLVGCSSVTPPPGEGEGEGEGEEEVSRVVMVELFSQDGCSSCAVVEPIIEQLAEEYKRSEVVFLEERAYGPYSLDEIRERYNWYIPNEEDRSTPNILFDGLNTNLIHGTSTYSTINSKISSELGKDAKIKITAVRNSNSDSITITGTIENISSSDLSSLVVTLMTYEDKGEQGVRYLVTNILTEEIGSLTSAGTYAFSITVDEPNWVVNGIHGVVLVQETASSKKEVLQVLYVE